MTSCLVRARSLSSFGGMYAQKLCEAGDVKIGALVLLCSVSPRGSTGTVMRYLFQKPKLAWEIVRAFVFKEAATDVAICRRVFFSDTEPSDAKVSQYMANFAVDSKVGLDTRTAPQQFPGKTGAGDDGRCSWLERLPPTLVVGADADKVVDKKAVEETADFYDSKLIWVEGPHDIMLDPAGMYEAPPFCVRHRPFV
jgi:pimeloyl-ACP methyl ester carboxylesterase